MSKAITTPPADPTTVGLNRHELAQRLGISIPTVDRLIASGELRAKRVGRRVIVAESEVARFLAD